MNFTSNRTTGWATLVVLAFLCLTLMALHAQEASTSQDVSDFHFSDEYFSSEMNALAFVEEASFRTLEVKPEDIALLFATYPLDEPLWQDTRAPAGRDVLYLLPQKLNAIEYGGLAVSLFYNQTNRMPVSAKTLFGDLFDPHACIENPPPDLCAGGSESVGRGFIPLLKAIVEGAVEGSELDPAGVSRDIVTLLPFFRNLTIQQRQVGLFFQGGVSFGPFMLQVHTPFIVSERNFWLSLRDIDFISELMKAYYQGADFDYKEVVHFRAGLGDTRLKLGLNMVNMTNFAVDFGAEAILPTSLFFYDPRFTSASQQILKPDPIGRAVFESNMTNVLRGVRDYFLDPRLGNGGHFGTGIYLESKVGLFHDFVQLWTRFSYDLLFKAKEDRLFMLKPTMTVDDLEPVITGAIADKQMQADIVNTYLRQYVFPSSFRCTVKPGGVFNAIVGASVNYKRWRFTFGYDFYARQGERIHKIHNSSTELYQLLIEKGIANHVEQHKLFSESLYTWSGKKSDLAFGYGTDFTLISKNIGNDWTVYLKFVASF